MPIGNLSLASGESKTSATRHRWSPVETNQNEDIWSTNKKKSNNQHTITIYNYIDPNIVSSSMLNYKWNKNSKVNSKIDPFLIQLSRPWATEASRLRGRATNLLESTVG